MIGSFMDESFDMGRSGVFAVGGLLGRGVAFFELERRWEKLRTRPDINIGYFKASQCERGKGEFSKFVTDPTHIMPEERTRLDSIGHEFLQTIVKASFDKSYLIIAGMGVMQDHFYEITKDAKARSILGDTPYRLAYDLAMIQCAWAMKKLGTGDAVSFVCDENEEHSSVAGEAYRNLKGSNPNAAAYMGSFSMTDEKHCQPLQAADAVIFEIRRALRVALGHWKGELGKRFDVLTDTGAMFLIQRADREQLIRLVETHKPGEPFKLDEIMDQDFQEDVRIVV
jgi:Protein of unknown function (DUF3800)